jgi:hypothetical protein
MSFRYNRPSPRGPYRPFVTPRPAFDERNCPNLTKRKVTEHERYDVWDITYQVGPTTRPKDMMTMRVALSKAGHYIGMPDEARYLCDNLGIDPEPVDVDHDVCTVGYSAAKGKWYGWSHRALYGFAPGAVVKEGDSHAETIPPGTKANNLAEAKWFATAFAKSVS